MKRLLTTALFALFLQPAAWAADSAATPPSDASVKQLLTVTESSKLVDETMKSIDDVMFNGIRRGLAGAKLGPEEQKIIDEMRTKMTAMVKEELTWEKFEPRVIEIYKKSFSQDEINGMLAFYKTSAGQAVIAKMPGVMRNSTNAMQAMMAPLGPKLNQLQKDTLAQIKAGKPQK